MAVVAAVYSLAICMVGCGGGDTVTASVSAPYEGTVLEAAPEDTVDTADEEDAPIIIPIETCLSAIEGVLEVNYGENYAVTLEGDVVTVGVWTEGIALGAMAAVAGDTDAADAWDAVMDAMVSLDDSIQGVLEDCGHGELTALVNVVNDLDTDSTLASIRAGEVVYDAVNGIDLIGAAG